MAESPLIDPDERLTWSAKPDPIGYAIRKGTDLFLWGVIALGLASAARHSVGLTNPLFDLFVLIAIISLLSPLYYLVRARHTDYAITDRRAIVKTTFIFPLRIAVPFDQIETVELRSSVGRLGHVLFLDHNAQNFRRDLFGRVLRDGSIAIPDADAERVGQTLKAAVEKAAAYRQLGRTPP